MAPFSRCLLLCMVFVLPRVEGAEKLLKVTWTRVRADGLVATYLRAKGEDVRPALIVVGGSQGGLPEALAYKFAERGWATLAVAYFGAEGLPPSLANIPIEYGDRAIAWLQRQPFVDTGLLGIVGVSRGSEFALLLAARNPALKRVVAYSPSHVVWGPVGSTNDPAVSAWTTGGQPLPHVPHARPPDYSAKPYRGTPDFLADLRQSAAVQAAAIPVEKIRGDILLISGDDDQMWPASFMARQITRRLEARQHAHRAEHLSFPGAGHLLSPDSDPALLEGRHPTGMEVAFGGSAAANREAQRKSWAAVLDFLRAPLVPPAK
jgi:dienelactone hydrolase